MNNYNYEEQEDSEIIFFIPVAILSPYRNYI